ncbi:hypothetical protein D770_16330 [Flammeovirgaceae bacterium 311]|nr:hypothetical protein D770_16330 [Flammeovirgaceae bacterium 311]
MSTRKIYTLLVVLGLAMVWLGFLFTYELKIAEHRLISVEQEAPAIQLTDEHTGIEHPDDEELQTAGFSSGDAESDAGLGFPIALASLGMVFVLGGAFTYRRQRF